MNKGGLHPDLSGQCLFAFPRPHLFHFLSNPPPSPTSSRPPQGPDLHSLSTRLTVAMATVAEQAPSPIARRSLCKWYLSLTVTACKIILRAHRQVIKLNFQPVDRMSTAHEWWIKRRAIAEDDVGSLWEHMTVKGGVRAGMLGAKGRPPHPKATRSYSRMYSIPLPFHHQTPAGTQHGRHHSLFQWWKELTSQVWHWLWLRPKERGRKASEK